MEIKCLPSYPDFREIKKTDLSRSFHYNFFSLMSDNPPIISVISKVGIKTNNQLKSVLMYKT